MQEVLTNMIDKMDQNMSNLVDDKNTYIKDDLKYCSICNEPLETIIIHPFTGEERKVNCICKCTVDKMKQEEEERRNFERQREIEKLQRNSLLGDRYKNVRFDNTIIGENEMFDEAYNRCKNYCAVSSKVLQEGYGIYIYGNSGTGKTHLTACMVNELVNQNRPTLFTNFFEISQMIRGTFNDSRYKEIDMIEKISNVDFLFIDDLGTERVKKDNEDTWLQEKIFEVLNKRYNNKKPTVFTSNYSLSELVKDRGLMRKTVDRILEMSTRIIKIEGESHRIQNRVNNIPF